MNQTVLIEIRDRIARITLNRPEQGNALNIAAAEAFKAAVDQVASDSSVRVVLLTGAGKRFCVGGDIGAFAGEPDALAEVITRILTPIGAALKTLASLPVTIVTALNGAVGGGGVGLALCADLVVAGESAKLASGYSMVGLSPDASASWQLTRRIGPTRAKELFLTNRALNAQECLQWGIVNTVVPDAELMAHAERLAASLAGAARASVAAIATLVDGAHERTLEEQLDLETELMIASAGTADAREGVLAFTQKRRPEFLP